MFRCLYIPAVMMVEKWNQKKVTKMEIVFVMKKFLPALRDHGFLFPDIDPAGGNG